MCEWLNMVMNEHGFDGDADDADRGWTDAKLGFVPMGALLDVM